jgi:copper chaperone CopZ
MSRGTYGPDLKGAAGSNTSPGTERIMETTTFEVGGMSCGGCVANLTNALSEVAGVKNVEAEVGSATVHHDGACNTQMSNAITGVGFTLGTGFDWKDGGVWKQSAHNTKWCLIGCSIGDFGTIAAFQFLWPDSGWNPMWIMVLAMVNGLLTSIGLETVILVKQMDLGDAFRVAVGMSLISMLAMEAAMNVVDLLLTGGAVLTWWVIPIMLVAGFITPWPYNYWRLKKFGVACH